MGTLGRVALGVALGACATLFIHPNSRRVMMGIGRNEALEHAFIRAQARTAQDLPNPPVTLIEASLWMQLASERLQGGLQLSPAELNSLIRLAQSASDKDPQNPFWRQMSAVLYFERGDELRAKKEWLEASRLPPRWSDKQTDRLMRLAKEFAGGQPPLAWHYAAAYYLRQDAASEAILHLARVLTTGAKLDEPGLRLRIATLRNGMHMGGGARSVAVLRRSAAIVNLAGLGEGKSSHRTLKELEEERGKFHAALRDHGMQLEAIEAVNAYRESDGRVAVTQQTDPVDNAARTGMLAVLSSTLPGVLLVTAAIGCCVWGVGATVLKFAGRNSRLTWTPAILFGSALGVGVFSLTLLPLAGVVALLCAIFLTLTPRNERAKLPSSMGLVFEIAVLCLGVAFLGLLALYLIEASTQARVLLPEVGFQQFLFPGNLALGLSILLLVMLLLISPMWAFAKRIPTPFVLGRALRSFGRGIAALSLGGIVLAGPGSVYADARAADVMGMMVGHEPLYYVNLFE